jgi:hypothetical protein
MTKDKGQMTNIEESIMPITLINPFDETPHSRGSSASRLSALEGKTVALLDISKPGGSVFLDRIEALLKDRFRVAGVIRVMKPTFTKPAPDAVIEKIVAARVDAVIEALAD